jgi:hypothetical protein
VVLRNDILMLRGVCKMKRLQVNPYKVGQVLLGFCPNADRCLLVISFYRVARDDPRSFVY